MNNEIFKLFEFEEEYPQHIAEKGVPEDTMYSYVSSTLLNGYINYVEPIMAVMVERYGTPEEILTYPEQVKKLNKSHHTDFSQLDDDVLILAKTEGFFWFFWYDKDCSDCCIGRFRKSKCSEKDFIKALGVTLTDNDYLLSNKLYPLNLTGWISG